jgi:sugar phosphate permease
MGFLVEMDAIAPYAKAVTASLIAALTAIGTGLSSDNSLDWNEGIAAVIAFLVGLGAVWAIPNRPKDSSS